VARHHLQDPGTEPLEALRVAMLETGLRLVEREADVILHRAGKLLQVGLA